MKKLGLSIMPVKKDVFIADQAKSSKREKEEGCNGISANIANGSFKANAEKTTSLENCGMSMCGSTPQQNS